MPPAWPWLFVNYVPVRIISKKQHSSTSIKQQCNINPYYKWMFELICLCKGSLKCSSGNPQLQWQRLTSWLCLLTVGAADQILYFRRTQLTGSLPHVTFYISNEKRITLDFLRIYIGCKWVLIRCTSLTVSQ